MDMNDLSVIIIIAIAYLPVIYNLQKRLRHLENEVERLKKWQ